MQESESRVSVRRFERDAADPFNPGRVEVSEYWGRITGRATERGLFSIKDHKENRRRASPMSRFPNSFQVCGRRPMERMRKEDFQWLGPLPENKALDIKSEGFFYPNRTSLEPVKKWHLNPYLDWPGQSR